MKEAIVDILRHIAVDELAGEKIDLSQADYINQRAIINSIFRQGEYTKGQLILRLTVIDSLYSTNAAYSYFSIEEMAEKILALGTQRQARDYFYSIACLGKDNKKLFDEPYGIQKDLREGSKQMSLLSKYAYYELMQEPQRYPKGFPIYDRLAREAYPIVCRMLKLKPVERLSQTPDIEPYIKCINQLRKELFANDEMFHGFQQFDVLDAYLWRMGKFNEGNLSLLLGRDDYCQFIRNIKLDADTMGKALPSDQFNKLVLKAQAQAQSPFAKCSNEAYLSLLLLHWRMFNAHDRHPCV